MRTSLVLLALFGVLLVGAGVLAQQEVYPTPRAGTGVVTVRGTVDVGRMPEVAVRQSGQWLVSIDGTPRVAVAGSDFVSAGARYAITWADGTQETVTVAATGEGGWARVEHPDGGGRQRWVNLAAARAVEDVR